MSKGEKKKKHPQNLLSLGWEEGVGKKGSRQAKKDDFLKLCTKQANNIPVYEPPIQDSSVSDFVSSFEYRKDDISRSTFSDLVNIVENQTNKAADIVFETQNQVNKISDVICGARNLSDKVFNKLGATEARTGRVLELAEETETLDMEEAFVMMEGN